MSDIKKLNIGQLYDKLISLGINGHSCCQLEDAEVDGKAFLMLTENDLKDIDINLGPRKHIMSIITQHKNNMPSCQQITNQEFDELKKEFNILQAKQEEQIKKDEARKKKEFAESQARTH